RVRGGGRLGWSTGVQSRDEPVDSARDILPVSQPVARKSEGDIGVADAALEQADAHIGDALARAAREKMFGRIGLKNKIVALIGRAVTKTTIGQTGKSGGRLRHEVAGVDCLHALHQWQGGIA